MSVDEMFANYLRLRQELADAYGAPRWNKPHLNRLTEDISRLEHALPKSQPVDKQTNNAWPPFVNRFSGGARKGG